MNDSNFRFHELRVKRMDMERNCTDPDKWRDLAAEFGKIGAYANQEKCQERAEHYAQVN